MNANDLQDLRKIGFWVFTGIFFIFLIILLFGIIMKNISDKNYIKNHEKIFNYIESYSKENDIEEDVITTFKIKEICSDNNDGEINEDLCLDRVKAYLTCNKGAKHLNEGKYWYLMTDKRIPITHEETIKLSNNIKTKDESEQIINTCNELLSKNTLLNDVLNKN